MYSLAQKVYFAKREGNDEVVLTLEEAEWTLKTQAHLDQLLARYMDYVPESALRQIDIELDVS